MTTQESATSVSTAAPRPSAWRFAIPLAIFVVLVFFLWRGLWRDPREVPSVLLDKPAPQFTLPVLADASRKFSPADYRGKVWLLNVWGSWCISCQVEHPTLLKLARLNVVPIVGFDWKDKPDAAQKWLREQGGDPYVLSVTDLDGRVAIDYGVYGAPETFVIDKAGIIRHKQIGPLTADALKQTILPLVRELQRS